MSQLGLPRASGVGLAGPRGVPRQQHPSCPQRRHISGACVLGGEARISPHGAGMDCPALPYINITHSKTQTGPFHQCSGQGCQRAPHLVMCPHLSVSTTRARDLKTRIVCLRVPNIYICPPRSRIGPSPPEIFAPAEATPSAGTHAQYVRTYVYVALPVWARRNSVTDHTCARTYAYACLCSTCLKLVCAKTSLADGACHAGGNAHTPVWCIQYCIHCIRVTQAVTPHVQRRRRGHCNWPLAHHALRGVGCIYLSRRRCWPPVMTICLLRLVS